MVVLSAFVPTIIAQQFFQPRIVDTEAAAVRSPSGPVGVAVAADGHTEGGAGTANSLEAR